MKNLQKIISGGQTGVDQAALRVALELNFRIGGWCPPGRICENGKIPAEYPLTETTNERSPMAPDIPRSQRTEYNVRNSDATLILKPEETKNDPGTGWTIQCAREYKKPYLIIDPYTPEAEKPIFGWLLKTPVEILNIAGPSENTSPGISKQAFNLLFMALTKYRIRFFDDKFPVYDTND
ncbi:MAG: putative molybdenum carrier protein [Bacteroidales bacterium]|nr:putative molybdenum carrier protein [Bacteroidales bacterium]